MTDLLLGVIQYFYHMLRMEDICKDKVSLGNFTILFHKKKYLTVALKKVDCGFESGFGL